jgi:hypothetical protein
MRPVASSEAVSRTTDCAAPCVEQNNIRSAAPVSSRTTIPGCNLMAGSSTGVATVRDLILPWIAISNDDWSKIHQVAMENVDYRRRKGTVTSRIANGGRLATVLNYGSAWGALAALEPYSRETGHLAALARRRHASRKLVGWEEKGEQTRQYSPRWFYRSESRSTQLGPPCRPLLTKGSTENETSSSDGIGMSSPPSA